MLVRKSGGGDGRWNREVIVDNLNIPDNNPWTGPAAYRHELMKAVLMNSADKLKDDGSLDYPGIPGNIPEGHLLGMTRTVIRKDGSNYFASTSFPGPSQVFPDLVPLDIEMGAGHLNALRAFDQYKAGGYQYNEEVAMRAWAVGETATGGPNRIRRYQLEDPISDQSFVSLTLTWDRHVPHIDGDMDFEFDAEDMFEGDQLVK